MIADKNNRFVCIMGHPEYDANTLANEYFRDLEKGLEIQMPVNYFPDNDPERAPGITWRSHANLFFSNWLNFVYQETPYDITDIGP